jgi:DNA-directed RNA polymerase subunit RPC12/RpoP
MRELNLETLVWTRGRKMPISDLKDRMMCPQCGSRRISIIFDPKPTIRAQAV